MMRNGLIDKMTFSEIYAYRVENLVANRTIVETKLRDEKQSWQTFLALMNRLDIQPRT